MTRTLHIGLLTFALFSAVPAKAEDRYDLLHPVLAEKMREFSTDRPDKTESPYTLDAGHFQLEMDIVNFVRDRVKGAGEDRKTDAFGLAPFNFRVGLSDGVDLQIVFDSYSSQKVTDYTTHTTTTTSGIGDLTLRTKINLWGNDSGKTALAIMPFVKVPTASRGIGNGKVEGGVIVPLAIGIADGLDLGLMTEVNVMHNELSAGFHPEFVNSVTVGKDLTDKLGIYVEAFTSRSAEAGAHWVNTGDLGITYALTKNIQLDAGVNVGLTQAADDLNTFLGLSVRW